MSVLSLSNAMSPSSMLNVRGATNPAPIVDGNFSKITAHWPSLSPLQSVTNADPTDMEPDDAAAAVDANFAQLKTELLTYYSKNVPLLSVADSDKPELDTQYNFELINSVW